MLITERLSRETSSPAGRAAAMPTHPARSRSPRRSARRLRATVLFRCPQGWTALPNLGAIVEGNTIRDFLGGIMVGSHLNYWGAAVESNSETGQLFVSASAIITCSNMIRLFSVCGPPRILPGQRPRPDIVAAAPDHWQRLERRGAGARTVIRGFPGRRAARRRTTEPVRRSSSTPLKTW